MEAYHKAQAEVHERMHRVHEKVEENVKKTHLFHDGHFME